MVALKWLLVPALTSVSVLAQAPATGDPAVAAAYWNVSLTTAVGVTSPSKRDIPTPRDEMCDPYVNCYCKAPYTEPPCATTCNRNNCYRGFLNARTGSNEAHCPQEAYAFCCIWNYASQWEKYWAVDCGLVYTFAPWTQACDDQGDTCWDVVNKINDVCGCTLHHEVTDDVDSTYYELRWFPPYSEQCRCLSS